MIEGIWAAVEVASEYRAEGWVNWGIERIGADIAWEVADGSGVWVGVLDSGIDGEHEGIGGEIGGDIGDVCGHGTHLAGIVRGVAPGAGIYSIRVLGDNCHGTYEALASGIERAADAGVRVILIASGAYGISERLEGAVRYAEGKGCLVIAAAGNDGSGELFYPSAYAYAVSGTDYWDNHYYRSNYGGHIWVSAPAVEIISAKSGGGYDVKSGTSMAAAHAAGAAALLWSSDLGLSAAEVKERLCDFADDYGEIGRDGKYGCGRINVWRAIAPMRMWLPIIIEGAP